MSPQHGPPVGEARILVVPRKDAAYGLPLELVLAKGRTKQKLEAAQLHRTGSVLYAIVPRFLCLDLAPQVALAQGLEREFVRFAFGVGVDERRVDATRMLRDREIERQRE